MTRLHSACSHRFLNHTLVVFLFLLGWVSRAAIPLPADDADFTPQEIAQGYREGVLLAKPRAGHRGTVDAAEAREGRRMKRKFNRLGDTRLLEPADGETVAEAVARLQASGRYDFVEVDRIIRARTTAADPSFPQQWPLNNTGQTGGRAGADIGAVSAWDTLHDAPGVIVAVIDSGMRMTHRDLAANLWTNASPSSTGYANDLHGINATVAKTNANSGNPADNNGHGTHVAGTIGAVGNNGIGISGVAWKVQLMPLKFLSADGSGSTSGNIACIDYAIAHGVSIINASYGSSSYSAAEFAAIQSARDAGIIFVAAAGNDGANTDLGSDYPAAYALDNIVTVAATDSSDALATFSNFGSGSVDLAAPGVSILSTYYSSDTSYQTLSGTSMAAPHVAGALALLKAQYPTDNYRQLINRLLRAATRLPGLSGKVQSGGRLNLAAALNSDGNTPFNDNFARRAVLSGANLRVRSSNAGATAEAGEPAHAGVSGGPTLWWSWTAPRSGVVSFDITGSSYAGGVAVYTGTDLPSLQPVASGASRADVQASTGVTYHVAVTGSNGAAGLTVLKIGTIPINDAFTTAERLEGNSVRVDTNNVNASRENGEPTITGVTGTHSLWYRWTAPASGRFMLAAFSTQMNTLAAVYTGSALGGLTLIGANNNSSSVNSDSLVGFDAVAGITYSFQIDNSGATGGDVTVTLTDAIWQYPTDGEVTSSPAVGSDGTVYFGSNDGYLYAVSSSGALRWRGTTSAAIDLSSPAVGADGTVYVGSSDGYLYAFNGTSGVRRWRFAGTTAISASPAIAADGTIYFRDDNALYALTSGTASATRKWSFALSGGTYGSPVIASDGTVYVGAAGGAFYAVNPSGSQKWAFTADGDVYVSPAIGADGTVHFATLSGTVYALSPSGAVKWSWHLSDASNGITSSPAIGVDGSVYFAAYDRKLHALRHDGVEKWTFTAGDEVRASSPAVAADGTIYFGAYDGQVYAVNSAGTVVRRFATAVRIRSSPALAGGRLYFGSNDAKLYAFNIGAAAAASPWPMFRQNPGHTARATTDIITITSQPQTQAVVPGSSVTLRVEALAAGAVSYQWYKDGVPIAGATGATYTVASATSETAGSYTVTIAGPSGTVTSSAAEIAVEGSNASGLINLSVRAPAGTGARTLTVGFVVDGDKTILVRGIGPTLAQFGVEGTLADPTIALFASSGVQLQSNDNWSGSSALSSAFSSVGAFALSASSKDAALVRAVSSDSFTAQLSGAGGGSGAALAEIYDATPGAGGRLVNLSARAQVDVGADPLIGGFVISGNSSRQLLIRGIGPSLSKFGVEGVLADPKLELYRDGVLIDSNDNWGGDAALSAAFTKSGAFSLTDGSSKDAVILVTLPPGGYTAQVRSAGATSGVALIEIYEVR